MIYSVGHSILDEHKFEELIDNVDILWDIRSHPGSKWPQFNRQYMETWMERLGKKYVWKPELGGWRNMHLKLRDEFLKYNVDVAKYSGQKFPKGHIAKKFKPQDLPLFEGKTIIRPTWTNVGLYDYSWFMILPEFIEAAQELIELGKTEHVGIMCCECLWWKCHRSMVSDYIVSKSSDILHLQPKFQFHSTVIGNRLERYDTRIIEIWNSRQPASAVP